MLWRSRPPGTPLCPFQDSPSARDQALSSVTEDATPLPSLAFHFKIQTAAKTAPQTGFKSRCQTALHV